MGLPPRPPAAALAAVEPLPLHVAERLAQQAMANGTPVGPRTIAALLAAADNPAPRGRAAAELIVRNDALVAEVERHTAAARAATAELADLNDRVGTLTDELSEAQHDRQVLAAENGAMRDELDVLRGERDDALLARDRALGEHATVYAEAAQLRAQLDAAEARDLERTRQAMLMLDGLGDGGV